MESVLTLGQDFLTLQEERVRQYVVLEEAHRVYLATRPEYKLDPYKQEVAKVTENFKSISTKIIEIRSKLSESQKDLANFINKVQILEEKKLRFTVDLQLAKQQALDNPEDELLERNVKGIKKEINNIVENINEALEDVRCRIYELREEETERWTWNLVEFNWISSTIM